MPGPSGEMGAGKLAAAQAAQTKRVNFLASLRVECSDEARELITGQQGQVLIGKAIDLALGQVQDVADGKLEKVSYTFTDRRGVPVPLVKIAETRTFIANCQRTINKWLPKGSKGKKSVNVGRNNSRSN